MQNHDFKVVIIGGGLVGSLAAVYFANRGFTVHVYEKREDIRKQKTANGRSINLALSTRGIEALKGAGVADQVLPNIIPMKGRMIHSKKGDLSSQPYGLFGECINSVDRKWMNEILLSAAEKSPQVSLFFEWGVERIDFDSGKIVLSNDAKQTKTVEDADLIIGADGAYSKVRQQIMRHIRFDYSQEYIDHAYVELCMPPLANGDYAMDSNHLHIWPRQTFMMIALPNQDHSFTVTLFMPWSKFEAIQNPHDLEVFFQETFPDSIPLIGRELLIHDYFKNAKGSLISIKCKPYNVSHKAVILGDAAHAMVPFYGQGMNCGFEDVLVLDEIFQKHLGRSSSSPPSAAKLEMILKEYSHVRNPDAEAMCDLALHNYIEMRSSVTKPRYLLRKRIEGFLHKIMPSTVIPLYTMVSFSRIRYSEALARFNRQTNWFEAGLNALRVAGVAATLADRAMHFTQLQMAEQPSLTACEYKTGKTLGQGSYATVKEAVKIKTGEKFAVKMISKKLMKGREYMILNEIEVLKKISQGHPNILNLWDYFETPNNLYLVMDLCTGGELFDRICEVGQFYEKDAARIIHTVLGALKYLHELNVVHRDLKPENLLFKDKSPNSDLLIADFGLSKYIDNNSADDALKTTCGTPGYMAPEVLQKLGHGKSVDMWSIGVMSFFLLCGYMPFETKTEVVDLNLVLKGMYSFDEMYWADVSQTAKDFIIALLLVDPKRRMTVEKALAHPWMTDSFPIPTKDLFPNVRKGFNARKTFKKAIDVVKAVNKLSSSSFSLKAKSNISVKSDEGEKGNASRNQLLTVANPALGTSASPVNLSAVELERKSEGSSPSQGHGDDNSAHMQNTLLLVPGSQDPLHRAITNCECLGAYRKQKQLMAEIQVTPAANLADPNAKPTAAKAAPAKDAAALAPCEYKTGKTLGQGSYGVVKEGVKISTGERFAVKMISKKLMRGKEALILNEINILKKVSKGNKNIVTLHDYFESPNNLYLVMDLCTGGELFDRIINKGYFYEEDAAKIIRTVCSAIQYLHQNNIVHRDLKPENLIFRSPEEDSDLLIADFGLSRITADPNDHGLKTYAGTPGYMAPEIIQKTGHGKPVDMWAIGVMSYFLLAGTLPFESASNAEEVDNVVHARYSYDDENWQDISFEAKKFIDSVVIVDPSKRLTAEDALKTSWLNPQRVSTVVNKDLLPVVRSGFDARKMFKKAFDVVRAVNKLSHSNLFPGSRNPSQVSINVEGLGAEDRSRNPSSSNIFLGNVINSRNPSMKGAPVNLGMTIAHSAAASQESIYKTESHSNISNISNISNTSKMNPIHQEDSSSRSKLALEESILDSDN